jgi:BCD family chlorophyll transporter-like MFS transporter
MGLWGAAQGIAFGLGGFGGTLMIDMARALVAKPEWAYALVFGLEAAMFVAAAVLAIGISPRTTRPRARVTAPSLVKLEVQV